MLLKTDNICTNYGAVEAIRNINMYVEEGEVVAFIGHNGAGKTTLLKTISGLLRPVKGTVTWMGENITGRPPEKIGPGGNLPVPGGAAGLCRIHGIPKYGDGRLYPQG